MKTSLNKTVAMITLVAICLTGCLEGQDFDRHTPGRYSLHLPDRDLPATVRFSDADQEGLTLAEQEFPLSEGPGTVVLRFQTTETYSQGTGPTYCLSDDVIVVDDSTGAESVGIEAGTCISFAWKHPDID